jgi:adenylate kinase
MFRNAVTNKTELGVEVEKYLASGTLVPDELVIGMIMHRIAKPDAREGFLLDGFPRTLPQAQVLDDALNESNNQLDAVVVLQVADDIIITRTTGRRIDPVTGRIYHMTFSPPHPDIMDRIIQRDDDREEIVRTRLEKYRADTSLVLPFYQGRGLTKVIAAEGKVEVVRQQIAEALGF